MYNSERVLNSFLPIFTFTIYIVIFMPGHFDFLKRDQNYHTLGGGVGVGGGGKVSICKESQLLLRRYTGR